MNKIKYVTNQQHPQIKSYKRAIKLGRKSKHILMKDGVRIVKRSGAERATKIFDKQSEEKEFATRIAKNNNASLF